MVSGGQRRFPGGSALLSQDLSHEEDMVGKEGEESIPCIKTALQTIRREIWGIIGSVRREVNRGQVLQNLM